MTKEERDELAARSDAFDALTEFAERAERFAGVVSPEDDEGWSVWTMRLDFGMSCRGRNGEGAELVAGGTHKQAALLPVLDRLAREIGQAVRRAADEAAAIAKKL